MADSHQGGADSGFLRLRDDVNLSQRLLPGTAEQVGWGRWQGFVLVSNYQTDRCNFGHFSPSKHQG